MFDLILLTMDGKKHEEKLSRISLPTADGVRTILTNHMPAVIPVEIGIVRLIKAGESEIVVISEGIFNFQKNTGQLFVRTFEFIDEIDVARAERAKKRAEEKLEEELSYRDLREAELALQRAITRISATR